MTNQYILEFSKTENTMYVKANQINESCFQIMQGYGVLGLQIIKLV